MEVLHTVDLAATPAFEKFQSLVDARFSEDLETSAKTHRRFEVALVMAALQLVLWVFTKDIERFDIDADGIIVGGRKYRRKHRARKRYVTSAGEVDIERTVYVERGGKGGQSIVPLELVLGMVGGFWTQRAAELGCRYMEESTSAKSAELLSLHGGMAPSASSLDRLPKEVSTVWEANREALEVEVRTLEIERLPAQEDVAVVVVSTDGIMLNMKDAPSSEDKEGPRGYKEVGCGTISLLNAEGERLKTVKVGRAPEAHKKTLVTQLAEEMKALKEKYPKARWQGISDGARENWRIFSELSMKVGVKMERTLDFWHGMEHLSDALELALGSTPEAKAKELAEWRETLKSNCHGPGKLIRRLEELESRVRGKKNKEDYQREIRYFRTNKDAGRMRWARLLKRSQPIGSGPMEATCKTLVTERMKRSGMSWLAPGAQAILTLRGLHQSGRMEAAWEALGAYFTTDVQIDPEPHRKRPSYAMAA